MAKLFGEGIYSAYRQNGILHVRCIGMKPYAQTKVSLEELPFLIYPPQIGLFFETSGIVSPVELPFDIERAFAHYPDVPTVHIVDKNGGHSINIEDKPATTSAMAAAAAPTYVVYRQIGTNHYLIAEANKPVIEIYYKVFGPDTYENCQKYVTAHSPNISPAVDLVPGTLRAWIDKQPGAGGGGPPLIVTVDAMVRVDWGVDLVAASPQGFNPLVKLLKIDVKLPDGGAGSNAIAGRTLRYEEAPATNAYTDVTLLNGGQSVSAKVTITH